MNWGRCASVVAMAAALAACGDGNSNPSGPSGSGPVVNSGSGPGPSGATITIGANGAVNPAQVTITTGQSVTFVNSSSASREMSSDPHPAHTNCPSMAAIGIITAGQTKVTNSFTNAGTCRFHDHVAPDNNSLKGTIVIQ